MSINTGYNILSQALDAFTTELNTVGNNVANVNTAGYQREEVNLSELGGTTLYGNGAYQLGGGVTVDGVVAIQSKLTSQSLSGAQSGLGLFQSLTTALQGAQNAFPEPSSSGISEAMSGFFNAFSSLASNPGSSSSQLAVQQAAETLTGAVQSAYSQLQQQSSQTTGEVGQTISQINQLTGQISNLNQQIASQSGGGSSPNALIDQRAQDVQKLSGLVDIQTTSNPNNTINVYTNGLNLVDEGGATPMPSNYTAGSLTFTSGTTKVTIQGGSLAGQVLALGKLKSYTSQLDDLANNLTSEVNALYKTGKNSAGQTNQDFFTETNPPGGAAAFSLTAALRASAGAIASGTSGKSGDGALAQSIAALTTTKITALGSNTFGSYYENLVGSVGADVDNATNSQSTQNSLVQQIQAQQQSISGVNLDEEMSNMLMYQQSYESAAKALSVMDQTAEDLIQMVQ
jgi:flagellar hook-associated protein 1 FlgK